MAERFTTGKWFRYARYPKHAQEMYMAFYNGILPLMVADYL